MDNGFPVFAACLKRLTMQNGSADGGLPSFCSFIPRSVSALVVMYSINVFLLFPVQFGMTRFFLKTGDR